MFAKVTARPRWCLQYSRPQDFLDMELETEGLAASDKKLLG